MNNEIEFQCPYCGEMNYTDFFLSEGRSQNFIHDCEVCCKPIEVLVRTDNEGNKIIEIKNDEGF